MYTDDMFYIQRAASPHLDQMNTNKYKYKYNDYKVTGQQRAVRET